MKIRFKKQSARDTTCPHIKDCYKKEGNKLFFMFIVDTGQNKGLILQKRFQTTFKKSETFRW